MTRRALLAGAALAAAGFGASRLFRSGEEARFLDACAATPEPGWGSSWVAPHWDRVYSCGNQRILALPAGLRGTARHQPIPVFLLDRDFATGELEVSFRVTRESLGPGVLFAATAPFEFVGVTVERERLVLAEYGREQRRVLATAPAAPLEAAGQFHLRVRIESSATRAVLWSGDEGPPDWQLSAARQAQRGAPGVLAVHPFDREPVELEVSAFEARPEEGFAPTPPVCPVAMTGTPVPEPGGGYSARIQAWSAWPASVVFETSGSPEMEGAEELPGVELDAPPYVARASITAGGNRPVYWRARLRSRTSPEETVTPVHVLRPPRGDRPLVLAAASCAHLVGPPPNEGLSRLLQAAPEPPTLLVYEGDLGYANNFNEAAYLSAPDFFADRFQRLLAREDFDALRRESPVGFILDDHDYGPENNSDRTTVAPWAIDLWNRIHADPSDRGYFDTRFGDVHCLTLDVRRYSDPVEAPDGPEKTRLGAEQYAWLEELLRESDAGLFVVFCGGTFARRQNARQARRDRLVDDTFILGWPGEYRRALTLFGDVQADGRRVLLLSGDAHSMRIHHHPDPLGRPDVPAVVEFICSGLRARLWNGAPPGDPTVDETRHVLERSGTGLVVVDPEGTKLRRITLRAIGAGEADPLDLFPPLVLPFQPA
jgi:hypothetical protein